MVSYALPGSFRFRNRRFWKLRGGFLLSGKPCPIIEYGGIEYGRTSFPRDSVQRRLPLPGSAGDQRSSFGYRRGSIVVSDRRLAVGRTAGSWTAAEDDAHANTRDASRPDSRSEVCLALLTFCRSQPFLLPTEADVRGKSVTRRQLLHT